MFTPSHLLSTAPDHRFTVQEGHHVTLNYADPGLAIDYVALSDRALKMHLEDAVLQYMHILGWLKVFTRPESIDLSKTNLERIEAHFHQMNAARSGEIFAVCTRVPLLMEETKRYLDR